VYVYFVCVFHSVKGVCKWSISGILPAIYSLNHINVCIMSRTRHEQAYVNN